MSILSRRSILAGTAAGAAASAFKWTAPARAVVPAAENQAASFYRYKLGSMEITVLSDGVATVPVNEAFIPNVKVEALPAHRNLAERIYGVRYEVGSASNVELAEFSQCVNKFPPSVIEGVETDTPGGDD